MKWTTIWEKPIGLPASPLSWYIRSKFREDLICLRRGLSFSADSAAKVLTKFCTSNGSPKKFLHQKILAPKKSSFLKLSNHAWHYGSKTDRSYQKKQKSPKNHLKNVIFVWHLFPYLTLSKHCWHLALDNITFQTFYCFGMDLGFKMSHHEACWGWKCGSYYVFCKKFIWTKKII